MLFFHSPEAQSNQDRAPGEECDIFSLLEMLASSGTRAEGVGKAYLIGFVLAVTVVSVLAGGGITRRSLGGPRTSSRGKLMKLGSEWDWRERHYRRPGKTVIRSVFAGIDADEMGRIVWK